MTPHPKPNHLIDLRKPEGQAEEGVKGGIFGQGNPASKSLWSALRGKLFYSLTASGGPERGAKLFRLELHAVNSNVPSRALASEPGL